MIVRLTLCSAVLFETRMIELAVFAWKPVTFAETTHWSTLTSVVPPAVCWAKTPAVTFWVITELKITAWTLLPKNTPLAPFVSIRELLMWTLIAFEPLLGLTEMPFPLLLVIVV